MLKIVKALSILALSISSISFAQTAVSPTAMTGEAFEVVVAKPKQGISLDHFLEIDRKMEADFVRQLPGFISREVAVSKDGSVFVIVRWTNLKLAEEAAQKFMSNPSAKERNDAGDMLLYNHYVVGKAK